MALILEQGFNIKRGQEEAFQKWTAETRRAHQEGESSRGRVPRNLHRDYELRKGSRRVSGLWRIDSMAAFDAMEEAARDPDGDWGRINRDVTEFMDLPIGAQGSFSVLRPLLAP